MRDIMDYNLSSTTHEELVQLGMSGKANEIIGSQDRKEFGKIAAHKAEYTFARKCKELGLNTMSDPKVGNLTPDFLVDNNQDKVYVECFVTSESTFENRKSSLKLQGELTKKYKNLTLANYTLTVKLKGLPVNTGIKDNALMFNGFVKFIDGVIDNPVLDNKLINEANGLKIEITATKKEGVGKITVLNSIALYSNGKRISDRIFEKINKYGNVCDHPFLLVIGSKDYFLDSEELCSQLWGSLGVGIDSGNLYQSEIGIDHQIKKYPNLNFDNLIGIIWIGDMIHSTGSPSKSKFIKNKLYNGKEISYIHDLYDKEIVNWNDVNY